MRRSRPQYYKLIGRLPVPVRDVIEWARWFQTAERIVFKTDVGPLHVSTIFLGLDHNWSSNPESPPILFETMVFGGEEPRIIMGRDMGDFRESYQERYASWDEAQAGHARAIEWARQRIAEADAAIKFKAGSDQ